MSDSKQCNALLLEKIDLKNQLAAGKMPIIVAINILRALKIGLPRASAGSVRQWRT